MFKDHGLQPSEFNEIFKQIAMSRDVALTMVADHKEGRGPVGFIGAIVPFGKNLMIITEVVWFPWARARNKLAGITNFINNVRDDYVVLEFADERPAETSGDGMNSKGCFEHVCKYGVMRRVGTVHDLYGPQQGAALFQSRKRKN